MQHILVSCGCCRYLGATFGGGEDLQAAELGNGVQTLVSWTEDTPIPRQPKAAQIQEIGMNQSKPVCYVLLHTTFAVNPALLSKNYYYYYFLH